MKARWLKKAGEASTHNGTMRPSVHTMTGNGERPKNKKSQLSQVETFRQKRWSMTPFPRGVVWSHARNHRPNVSIPHSISNCKYQNRKIVLSSFIGAGHTGIGHYDWLTPTVQYGPTVISGILGAMAGSDWRSPGGELVDWLIG